MTSCQIRVATIHLGGGPEHLEMWLMIFTHGPPPPFGRKMTDPPLKQGWKLHDPPPS